MARLFEEVNAFGPPQKGREVPVPLLAAAQGVVQPLVEECAVHVHARAGRLVQTLNQLRAAAGKRHHRPPETVRVLVRLRGLGYYLIQGGSLGETLYVEIDERVVEVQLAVLGLGARSQSVQVAKA
jgi:hypothetical protein